MSYKTIQIQGKQVRYHRFLVEKNLGRKLSFNEVVHHVNGDKKDNRIENLQVLTRGEHLKKHPEILKKSLEKITKKIDINEIKKLRKNKSINEIAKHFNVSTMTIWYRMKKNKIKTTKLSDNDIKEIRILLKTNMMQKEIAKKYKVSPQLISNIKNKTRYGNK